MSIETAASWATILTAIVAVLASGIALCWAYHVRQIRRERSRVLGGFVKDLRTSISRDLASLMSMARTSSPPPSSLDPMAQTLHQMLSVRESMLDMRGDLLDIKIDLRWTLLLLCQVVEANKPIPGIENLTIRSPIAVKEEPPKNP